jgi:hypothetical protein
MAILGTCVEPGKQGVEAGWPVAAASPLCTASLPQGAGSQGQAPLSEPASKGNGSHGQALPIAAETKFQEAVTGQPAAALVATADSSPEPNQSPTGGGEPAAASGRTPATPQAPFATEEANAVDIAVAAATTPQTAPASLQWTSSIPRVADSQGQASRRQASLKESDSYESAAPITKEAAVPGWGGAAGQAATAAPRVQGVTVKPESGIEAAVGLPAEGSKAPVQPNPEPTSIGDLAFAARVQPAPRTTETVTVSPQPAPDDIVAPTQTLSKRTAESDASAVTVIAPVAAGADASQASYGQASENQPGLSLPTEEPSNSAPPRFVEVPQAPAKPSSTPVNDISLQVSQPGAQKVEVRIVQQAGEVRVAVHTGDSDLAHGLQQGLSDLVGRLQETGFRAEAWHPGGTTVESSPVNELRTTTGGSQNGDSQGHSGGSRQQEGERRQNESARPGWVKELDSSIVSSEQSQGASYGIGS